MKHANGITRVANIYDPGMPCVNQYDSMPQGDRQVIRNHTWDYSGPSILRPPMGRRKCILILHAVSQCRSYNARNIGGCGTKSSGLVIKGGLIIKGCCIKGLL